MNRQECTDSSYILGIFGGSNPVDEDRAEDRYDLVSGHDASASIVRGGEILAAYEQERSDRIKHSNKAPMLAAKECLRKCDLAITDMGIIAVPIFETKLDAMLETRCEKSEYWRTHWGGYRARTFVQKLLCDAFGIAIDTRRLRFIHHHWAHAALAYYTSGYDEALVMTMDGIGDQLALLVTKARGNQWETLSAGGGMQSLGYFYSEVTRYLGFSFHDEYKVMGMSSYGDPGRFRGKFRDYVRLLPNGEYVFEWRKMRQAPSLIPRREKHELPQQVHMDFAAAGQELFEKVAFHVLTHFQSVTGLRRVCLAGGAALNCVFNGKLLMSGLFDDVHVPPAAGDSGLSLGAALDTYYQASQRPRPPTKMRHAYLGPSIETTSSTEYELTRWSQFIDFHEVDDVVEAAAQLLAGGALIGWIQGASEYGPRALGNRSILADPRPASNRTMINRRVKGREEFRPFAPAILEEEVARYFDLPTSRREFPFMSFTFPVRQESRTLLGATTHVDGSSRVQTVSREQNPKFWELIHRFAELTGTPVLLNTSFNNSHEPIVESPADAIACFLTCDLDCLVLENHLVTKKNVGLEEWMRLCPSRPPFVKLHNLSGNQTKYTGGLWDWAAKLGLAKKQALPTWEIRTSFKRDFRKKISARMFGLLLCADGHRTIGELLEDEHISSPADRQATMEELRNLWVRRLVRLTPGNGILAMPADAMPSCTKEEVFLG